MKLRHVQTTKGSGSTSKLRDIVRDDLPFPGALVAGEVPPEYAPLLAAAPDLLAAAKGVLAANPAFRCKPLGPEGSSGRRQQSDAIAAEDALIAAIAKAEGKES